MTRKGQKVTERLRQGIAGCGKSRYRLSQETNIDPATLHRFYHGQGSLSADGIDRLAEVLDLELVPRRRRKRRG
jgi:ribosome-binding protein aMBF1 (putative translation factor)